MTELLVLDSVTKAYGRDRVLSSASVRVREGTIHAVVGRNGAGKTTLLQIASGLVRADQGFIRFRGDLIGRPRLHRMARRGFFYLPQRGLLIGRWTVRTHLETAGSGEVGDLPDDLRLRELLGRRAEELSGGERRRVALGIMLAADPECIAADEPFRGLAPKDVRRVGHHLRRLARRGCGLIVTGHEVEEVFRVADEVTWLDGGSSRYLGTPSDAEEVHAFRRRYLGEASTDGPSS